MRSRHVTCELARDRAIKHRLRFPIELTTRVPGKPGIAGDIGQDTSAAALKKKTQKIKRNVSPFQLSARVSEDPHDKLLKAQTE
ncbi:hypothetical protein CMV_030070 [Castanea mollissima]|uniref:Uncharacterized protein n=1 Tax=Castanea mollissima TaxID=60419 RepID=A0A8J4QAJ9_9ROSI|nr:hypothetical protein CMV_030070 [Castanea mollissima]